MILRFKQRFFSWFDSYDIYDENGNTVYAVKGQLSWGHCLKIFDAYGEEIGTVKERIFTFMPKFEMYFKNQYVGCISRVCTFKPKYNVDATAGMWRQRFWSGIIPLFQKRSRCGKHLQELFNWTDTYLLNIYDPADALCVLMIVLAIDAEKCSRNNG